MRLIDADALIEKFKQTKKFFIEAHGGGFGLMDAKDKARCDELDNCIAEVINAPTIEPSESVVSRNEYETLKRKWIEAEQRADYYDIDDDDIASGCVSVEPKRGKWTIHEYEYLTCSECGEDFYTGCDCMAEAKEKLKNDEVPNYCPNCGAKMGETKRKRDIK